ncbi:TetR/AcrR family transcriptional regulator [Streptomyces sp. ME18-1-4]|uniref:TetR/AcrR family transcriptional regulator n=1 Tax=Streptomyces sp. ME18-1-4 TaxID=3028685 RepID=UPI0029B71126|nr:TetR/AcrR family transcriptional regulator [Streptomyces sp. ME18-1-4]MDX3244633.1 TetR/AcrR family transcriptional regulator [Streptomyces sp. ME18-1-4]
MIERQRRIRSDSVANRDRIVQAATRMFGERGVEVPLDAIATAAGVGSATLHRHFRGRLELVHAVLDSEADRLAARAGELSSSGSPSWALRTWLLELIAFTTSFRGLAILLADQDADSTLQARHRALTDACQRLLASAQADGDVRATLDAGDLLKIAHGIAVAACGSTETAGRLLDLFNTGLTDKTGP